MWIGVVSDTHGNEKSTTEAVHMLRQFPIERVLHCGDIGSTKVVELLSEWPTDYVLGNVDDNPEVLAESIADHGGVLHGEVARLQITGQSIGVAHGHQRDVLQRLIDSGEFRLVCTGHTHRREVRIEESTWILNPGALHRARPHSLAVVDLDQWNIEILPLV
ncbi:MAG: metallophosphoesterase family protein [Pirellulaceae bacterium]